MKRPLLFVFLACLSPLALLADFSYQQSTKLTGGAMADMMKFAGTLSKRAREPVASTVAVKGHRMARTQTDSAEVIDLDKETITNINFAKKTYTVMTFEQMKEMLNEMAQRMRQPQPNQDVDLKFDVSTRETGQTKVISGLNTKEVILTLTLQGTDNKTGDQGSMKITSDMWIAPTVPGYDEVRNFERLMAAKMAFSFGEGANPMMPGGMRMAKGMAELSKEAAKLDGVPVLQVTTIQGQDAAGARGAGQPAPGGNPDDNGGRPAGLAGLAGRLGGFGRRKQPQDDSSSQTGANSQSAAAPGTLMETTTETSGLSSAAVDDSKFEVPAGFKQVEPEMMRRGRR